jgi:PadR family transcriptional regulator AphA
MSLRIALLGMLAAGGPATGYDLAKNFDGSLSHVWPARHSQIYPELAKLAADGQATVRDDGSRGRRLYDLTPTGRAFLDEWLRTADPAPKVRSESSLRLFLLPLLPPEVSVPLLRKEALRYAEQARALEAERDSRQPPTTPGRNGWYAADLGIRGFTAIRDWATATADHIESLTSARPL